MCTKDGRATYGPGKQSGCFFHSFYFFKAVVAAQSIRASVTQSSRFPTMPPATLHCLSPPALFNIDHTDVFRHWHLLGCHLVRGVHSVARLRGGNNPVMHCKTQRSETTEVQSERSETKRRQAIEDTFEGEVVPGTGRCQAVCPDYLTN